MGRKIWGLVGAALAAAVLASCATGYQKAGFTGGFTERRISDTAYFVSFSGNGFASRERVTLFWLYRCAELTLQQQHSLFVIDTTNRTSDNAHGASPLRPTAYADDHRGRFIRTGGEPDRGRFIRTAGDEAGARFVRTGGSTYVPIFIPGGGGAQAFKSSGTVLMYDRPLPQESLEAWDAQAVKDTLDRYVKSDGKSPAPKFREIVQAALVMHDDVGVQSIGGIDSPEAVPGTADAKPARTEESIRELLDGGAVRRIMRAGYRAATKSGNLLRVPATATWDITISPNGPVSKCRLVESTLSSDKMVQDATAFLQQLDFGPRDVRETLVKQVTFYFKPVD